MKKKEYFKQAAKGFIQSPVIGSGLDTFRFISKKYQSAPSSWSWYTHNHFLQLFSDTGLTGEILFILLIRQSLLKVKSNGIFGLDQREILTTFILF